MVTSNRKQYRSIILIIIEVIVNSEFTFRKHMYAFNACAHVYYLN